jgi:uncharacterized repeat protein (TIGR01451 family)
MRRIGGQFLGSALAALALAFVSGCFGVSQNPSYFPFLLPTGDIIRTHAKPPGLGYYSNFDKHACRIEVRPLDATNPVQTHHVLIATVYDANGKPRRNRRVEWMVEGVGDIIEVDESGYFPGRGYKVDNKYAVSYTNYHEHHISRGNANPNDDFVLRPGQTYCVIHSAVEGDTHVTAYAPEIFDWDHNRVVVTKHWVDAEWSMPPPAVNRAGAEHTIVTNVFRHTDHQPLANYRVRYRIIDGPPAFFLPGRTQETVVVSDLGGNAVATLAQAAPQPGINRIAIEIVRPPDPCSPSGAGIIIGRGETTKEWLAPVVALAKTGPAVAALGADVAYTIAVNNTGRVDSQAQTVHDVIPEGLQYVRSDPPATLEGNQLTWTLGALPAGQAHTLQVVFRSLRLGPVTNCANVTTVEGLRAESCATTQITQPQLAVTMTGPASAAVGAPVSFQIVLTNPGSGPATNLVLSDSFDPGFEHESRANPVELRLGSLAAGESRTIPITLVARQPGRLVNRVDAVADGGLRSHAEHAVNVQVARLAITKTGPTLRYVDRPAVFDIRVSNTADVPVNNVVVRDQLPPELSFNSATAGGQQADGAVLWNLGTLQPREERVLQVNTRAARVAPRVINVAVATGEPNLQAQSEAILEIRGLPAFRLEVVDVGDPAMVGGRVSYKIDVTNQGSLPGNQVEIVAILPPQVRYVTATGPTQPRVEGLRITFPAVDALQPQQTLHYSIDVDAIQPGDARLRVELRTSTLQEPVVETESTTIVPAVPGQAPAPAPVPPQPAPVQPPAGAGPAPFTPGAAPGTAPAAKPAAPPAAIPPAGQPPAGGNPPPTSVPSRLPSGPPTPSVPGSPGG